MFKVIKTQCKNCLLSKDAIVSPERRREILESIKKEGSFFICHKSSMEGGQACCRGFFEKMGGQSQIIQVACRLGVVEEVEVKDQSRLPSWREMNEGR